MVVSEEIDKRPKKGFQDLLSRRLSCFLVSAKVKAVLEEYNLGQTDFYPMPIREPNLQNIVPGDWYILNIRSQRKTLIEDMVGRAVDFSPYINKYILRGVKNKPIRVQKTECLDDDIWQ